MIRRVLLSFTLLLAAETAQAQIIGREQQRFSREPRGWVSLGIGWLAQAGFDDPETGDGWGWGEAPQWRATLEFPLGRDAALGVGGTLARVPLTFDGGTCGRCDADANISQLFGLFRFGGGSGFHSIFDLQAGITMFSNFREADTGTRLGTGKMSTAFSASAGAGFAYPFSPRAQFTFVQDLGLVMLKRQPGSSQTAAWHRTTRLGLRLGLGDR